MNQQQQPPTQQPPTQQNVPDTSQIPIPLTFTLAQVNQLIQVLGRGEFQIVKPLIDLITQQAQSHIAQLNIQQQAPQPAQLPPNEIMTQLQQGANRNPS